MFMVYKPHNVSLLIAKAGKSHTIVKELILPAFKEIIKTVLHHKTLSDIIRTVPLRNNSVRRRIDEMAKDVEISLYDYLKIAIFPFNSMNQLYQNNLLLSCV